VEQLALDSQVVDSSAAYTVKGSHFLQRQHRDLPDIGYMVIDILEEGFDRSDVQVEEADYTVAQDKVRYQMVP
jgi:hypothetical protein